MDCGTKFEAGFEQCAKEVSRYLAGVNGMDNNVKNRVIRHLSSCGPRTQSPQQHQQQEVKSLPVIVPTATPLTSLPGGCVKNNQHSVSATLPTTTTTAPVITTPNGPALVVATGAPLVATASTNQIQVSPNQLGRITLILQNSHTAGQIIPVYTNYFTPINSVSGNPVCQKPLVTDTVKANAITDTTRVMTSPNLLTTEVSNSPGPVNNANSSMWRPW